MAGSCPIHPHANMLGTDDCQYCNPRGVARRECVGCAMIVRQVNADTKTGWFRCELDRGSS